MRNFIKIQFKSQYTKIQIIIAFILALAALTVFGYWAITLVDRTEEINIVVAANDLTAPRVLSADDIKNIRMRRELLPSTAIAEIKDAAGMTLIHNVSKNQVITINEILGQTDPELGGFKIPAGSEGFMLASSWLAGPMPLLKKGDTITILVSGSTRNRAGNPGIIAQGIPVRSVDVGADGLVQRALLATDLGTSASILQARANSLLLEVIVNGKGPDL